MKKGWPAQVAILLSHVRKMLWDIVGVKIYSHMISEFLTRRSVQVLKLDRGCRIIPSLALRSFHQSALALQNGVPCVPAHGHTREPAQQGYPAPRTNNDGRDARQPVLDLAQDRHLQLPHSHASLAQKLVGPQCYRTGGSAP